MVVEASPVGFVRVASWGKQWEEESLRGGSEDQNGEKIKDKTKNYWTKSKIGASVGGW